MCKHREEERSRGEGKDWKDIMSKELELWVTDKTGSRLGLDKLESEEWKSNQPSNAVICVILNSWTHTYKPIVVHLQFSDYHVHFCAPGLEQCIY